MIEESEAEFKVIDVTNKLFYWKSIKDKKERKAYKETVKIAYDDMIKTVEAYYKQENSYGLKKRFKLARLKLLGKML